VRTLNATGFYKPTGGMKYIERRESRERLFEFTPADFEEAAVMEEHAALDDALNDIEKCEVPKLQALVAELKKQEARAARSEEEHWRLFEDRGAPLCFRLRSCLKIMGFLFQNFHRKFRDFRHLNRPMGRL